MGPWGFWQVKWIKEKLEDGGLGFRAPWVWGKPNRGKCRQKRGHFGLKTAAFQVFRSQSGLGLISYILVAIAMTATLSTEFQFLLDRQKVDAEVGKKLLEFGVDSIAKFGALVDTADELRDLLKSDFGLDSKAGGLAVKGKVAAILVAWTTAKKRADKLAEHEGQQEVEGAPKRIPFGDHGAMKKAFEAKHWVLEDEMVPAKCYVERIMDRVEKDDLKAELLTEVLCVRDDTEEIMAPVWGKTAH